MAKLVKLWEGLQEGRPSGTYIRPHTDGTYEFGRWAHSILGHYRFTRIGERPTREACREALEADDKAHERRAKQLNKRRR